MTKEFKNILKLLKSTAKENIHLGLQLAKNYSGEFQENFKVNPLKCEDLLIFLIENKLWDLKTPLNEIKGLPTHGKVLEEFPASIHLLKNLLVLDLRHKRLQNLPIGIMKLKNLQGLYLSDNKLQSLPTEIGQLQNLQTLELNDNGLENLPAEIGLLQNVEKILLSNNKLITLPVEIGQLQKLKELSLFGNKLEYLPAEMRYLQSLEGLRLWDNQLKMLPAEIGELQNLQELLIQNNLLQNIPSEIGKLKNLQYLNLNNNLIEYLPVEIGELQNLQFLDLGKNQLKTLPKELKKLKNCWIYVGLNHNLVLPQELQGWEHIINMTSEIADALDRLKSDFDGDRDDVLSYEKYIGEEFQQHFGCTLSEYKELMDFLIENKLWDFKTPLNKIEKLSGYGQGLDQIPSSIYLLHNLKKLDLRNNFFKTLPKELKKLPNCKIYVNGNHNLVLPEELQDWENIIM